MPERFKAWQPQAAKEVVMPTNYKATVQALKSMLILLFKLH
jgi:hypothetical protein